jgi:hypothetical protein
MNVAVLFNSDHPTLGGWYGASVMQRILGTNVLQSADRNMRVSVGDVLTFGAVSNSANRTIGRLIALCKEVYRPSQLDLLISDRLDDTHGKTTVFCWLFENMTPEVGRALHTELTSDPAYLGIMDVDFSLPVHLALFRNSLPEVYRLRGSRCWSLYTMGENDDPDIAIREIFEQHGFQVDYEDAGARRTIFDNYDTLEHFQRVKDFNRVFSAFAGLSDDQMSDMTLTLEDLHPKLLMRSQPPHVPWSGQKPQRIWRRRPSQAAVCWKELRTIFFLHEKRNGTAGMSARLNTETDCGPI